MIANLFNFDSLAIISTSLILFISSIVFVYSITYLKTDKNRWQFLVMIFLISIFLIITFCANNIFLMPFAWMMSNLILVLMMIHKKSWSQAKNSGLMALKNFTIGFISLSLALYILHQETSSYLISEIVISQNIDHTKLILAASLILIAALSQVAIYPFHSYLLSSLNSPTPTSAIMHAGLVNGGGIIMARFAELFFEVPEVLTIAFILGIFSAIIGTFWKLIQSNVKSMLACSTMSQMGFMIAQCAMGLFPAAIAHLFWHGMFKSYLFLSSPSAWQEKRLDLRYPPKISAFLLSIICGLSSALIFIKITKIDVTNFDTTLVLVVVCFIAASQVALTIIGNLVIRNFLPAMVLSTAIATLYSYSLIFIENLMSDQIFMPQQLNYWHVMASILLLLIWIVRLFFYPSNSICKNPWLLKFYVNALNASQASPATITANRNQYNYK